MKIKKINISNVATFKNYTQNFDFEKINVIFGYNGSGKTTLSRILHCLEKKEIVDGIKTEGNDDPSFSIETNTTIFNENNLNNNLSIKVFNKDYIDKNINYDHLTGILIAWEESQKKQNLIDDLDKKKDNLQIQIEEQKKKKELFKKQIKQLELKIDNQKSGAAKFIKNKLKGFNTSYDKTKLWSFIKDSNFEIHKDKSIDLEKEILNYNASNKKNIEFIWKMDTITEEYIEKLNTEILQLSILDSVKIPEITAEFETWVRDGIQLHQGADYCTFCWSPITEERKKALNSHFSDEYTNLLQKIDNEINNLEKSKLSKIEYYLDWYEELREEWEKQKWIVNDNIATYNQYISTIIETLEQKKKNVFNTNFEVEYTKFSLGVLELNTTIEKHRHKHQNFESEKDTIANKIITYKILEIQNSDDFISQETEIDNKTKGIEEIDAIINDLENDKIKKIKEKIDSLSQEIHELRIGAGVFNQYLDELLPSLDLKVEPEWDNFVLKRNDYPVKHLSEGERNVLSFVYFILSFSHWKNKNNELKENLKDWIVFIDDPMSSLDDSNMYLIAWFIKKHFKCAKQLFITTHNFSFWRCFRNNRSDSWYHHFLIEKKKGNSWISALDKEHVLVKHQSDYTFVYSKLKDFVKNPEIEENVTILNHLRKFLEYFSSFMYPNDTGIDAILEKFLEDEYKLSPDIESFILYQLSNEGSHMQTRTDFISKDPIDISENIQKVLKAIHEKYPDHVASLDNSEPAK